jgi:hypothetical protein
MDNVHISQKFWEKNMLNIISKARMQKKYQECSKNVIHLLSWQHIFSKIFHNWKTNVPDLVQAFPMEKVG